MKNTVNIKAYVVSFCSSPQNLEQIKHEEVESSLLVDYNDERSEGTNETNEAGTYMARFSKESNASTLPKAMKTFMINSITVSSQSSLHNEEQFL